MGFLRFLVKALIQGAFIFLLISFTPGLPPYVQFTEFKVAEPTSLEGTLSINTLLNNAEILFSGKIHGPEALVDYNGVLYTGVHGGEIVKLVDGKVISVTKFGERCRGFWDEKNCGRPLGMNFGPDGFLYVADAYKGIFKVNVNTGSKTLLVSVNEAIEDKLSEMPNSVDIAADGTIYWSTSTTDFQLENGIFAALADGSGRLIRYDPRTKKNEVLIEGLHFANGIVLSPNEEFILVAETMRSRIHRYYLKGPKKGERDIFIDGLPGLPDNLKSDGQGGFFVPLVVVRDKSNPILFQSLGPFPILRKFVSRVLALLEMGFEQIEKMYPNDFTKKAIHWVGHFESTSLLNPKGFILLQLDINGNVKRSFHNTDKSLSGISEAHWFNGAFYFGSPFNTYVGRVKLTFAEPEQKQGYASKQESPKQQAPSQQSQKPSPPSQQAEKPSPPPKQPQKPSPPPQQPQKPSPPPQQPQKPSPPPQQPQKPSPPPQQPQKPSPPPQQPQKPSPPPQKPSPPPQQTQKPSPPPQQTQKPSPPPQQTQKPSPPPQQTQKPSPPPQQTQKPSPPPQQTQKPSPPPQQTQKPSPPPQQAQKPSPAPQQAQKPSPPPQQTQKPSPPPQQTQKPSPPPQKIQKPSPSPQQQTSQPPQKPASSSQKQQQESKNSGVKP